MNAARIGGYLCGCYVGMSVGMSVTEYVRLIENISVLPSYE